MFIVVFDHFPINFFLLIHLDILEEVPSNLTGFHCFLHSGNPPIQSLSVVS